MIDRIEISTAIWNPQGDINKERLEFRCRSIKVATALQEALCDWLQERANNGEISTFSVQQDRWHKPDPKPEF